MHKSDFVRLFLKPVTANNVQKDSEITFLFRTRLL